VQFGKEGMLRGLNSQSILAWISRTSRFLYSSVQVSGISHDKYMFGIRDTSLITLLKEHLLYFQADVLQKSFDDL
jgi:hypothetical protein